MTIRVLLCYNFWWIQDINTACGKETNFMKLTLDILLYFIRSLHPEIICRTMNQHLFVGVKAFLPNVELTAQCLYIADLKELLKNRELLTEELTFLAAGDSDIPKEELKELPCTLILVDSCYEVLFLVNRIVDIFSQLQEWDKTMHIYALEGKSVQDLLDVSMDLLMYPVLIFDATFNVLAYTKEASVENTDYDRTVLKGYTDIDMMAKIREQKVLDKLKKESPLVLTGVRGEDQTDIYLNFYSGQALLGYASVIHGDKKPEQGYLDLVSLFAENISFCLKRDYETSRYGQRMYETFLLNLMNNSEISRERVEEQVQNMEGLTLEGRFALCVLSFRGHEKVPLPFIARSLAGDMRDIMPFIYNGQVCFLKILRAEGTPDEVISQWEMEHINRVLEPYDFSVGISNVFYDITGIRYAFLQAAAALRFLEKENRYCLYKDVLYFHLISLLEKDMPVSYMYPEYYIRMKEYDKEQGTNYCGILLTYLACDCNATHAAEKLFLHRNSVRKAVQTAEERWHISLSDPDVKRKLALSAMIDRYCTSR